MMIMNHYWDLTEKQRAELASDDIDRFSEVELMRKGVLRVDPPTLEDEPAVPATDLTLFRVASPNYGQVDVAFRSADDAAAFLALRPLLISVSYYSGTSVYSAIPLKSNAAVSTEPVYSEGELAAHKATIDAASRARERNQKATKDHELALSKRDEALCDMRDDWRECQQKARRMSKIRETFEDYKQLAGSESVAAKFLRKAFTETELGAFEEWDETTLPISDATETVPT